MTPPATIMSLERLRAKDAAAAEAIDKLLADGKIGRSTAASMAQRKLRTG